MLHPKYFLHSFDEVWQIDLQRILDVSLPTSGPRIKHKSFSLKFSVGECSTVVKLERITSKNCSFPRVFYSHLTKFGKFVFSILWGVLWQTVHPNMNMRHFCFFSSVSWSFLFVFFFWKLVFELERISSKRYMILPQDFLQSVNLVN